MIVNTNVPEVRNLVRLEILGGIKFKEMDHVEIRLLRASRNI